MRWAYLAALCGCNQIFGLQSTGIADPVHDARVYVCPAPDTGLPTFAPSPLSLVAAACSDYTLDIARAHATAYCDGVIVDGASSSGSLPPADLPTGGNFHLDAPRLSPSGDELFVRSTFPNSTTFIAFSSYFRGPAGWTSKSFSVGAQVIPYGSTFSVPSAGLIGRRSILDQANNTFLEMTQTGMGDFVDWTMGASYPASYFALATISGPSLTADGLTMIFYGSIDAGAGDIYFTQRTSLDDPWNAKSELLFADPDADVAETTPFLESDCSHVYYAGSVGAPGPGAIIEVAAN